MSNFLDVIRETGGLQILKLLVFSIFFNIIAAARIEAIDHLASISMVRISKKISRLLFLHAYKRKVTIWAIIMQSLNYISLLIAFVMYKILEINTLRVNRIFHLILLTYMGITFSIMIIDYFIYSIKHEG